MAPIVGLLRVGAGLAGLYHASSNNNACLLHSLDNTTLIFKLIYFLFSSISMEIDRLNAYEGKSESNEDERLSSKFYYH